MATMQAWEEYCVHVYSMKFSGNRWKQSSSSHLERKCKLGLNYGDISTKTFYQTEYDTWMHRFVKT